MLVQRLGSRTTMLIADFARAPILASIPLLHAADDLSFELLLAIVALLGCFIALLGCFMLRTSRRNGRFSPSSWARTSA
jgi:hypothetical protein